MKKDNSVTLADDAIISRIYLIRGQKVLLDKDLALLYHVTTGNLNKSVQRNLKRFPPDFMFKLDNQEFKALLFQIGIAEWGGSKTPPFVFTEMGVAMLSSILRSERAIGVNIQIMRIFTRVRQMLFDNTELRHAIEEIRKKTEKNTTSIELVFKYLDELIEKKETPNPAPQIGYKTN